MNLTQWISSYLLLYSTSVMEDGLQNGLKGLCLLSLMSLCNPFSLSVEWNQRLTSDKEKNSSSGKLHRKPLLKVTKTTLDSIFSLCLSWSHSSEETSSHCLRNSVERPQQQGAAISGQWPKRNLGLLSTIQESFMVGLLRCAKCRVSLKAIHPSFELCQRDLSRGTEVNQAQITDTQKL